MKKKFALSFVALASVALLAACGEVKSGASNAAGNSVDEKTIKIGFNFEETGAVAAYGTSEQKVPNWPLMKSMQQVVSMENKSK